MQLVAENIKQTIPALDKMIVQRVYQENNGGLMLNNQKGIPELEGYLRLQIFA